MIRLKLYLLILIAALAGCKKQEAQKSYKLIDTGMWTSVPGGPFTWLDNERVLFPSNEKLAPGGGPKLMTVWKPATGKVEFFQPWGNGIICVEDGEITFSVTDQTTSKVTYFRGPIEKPQEYPPPRPNMYMRKNFGCGWADKDSREIERFPYRIKLRGENFLKVTGENEMSTPGNLSSKIVYFEREGDRPVNVPSFKNLQDTYSPKYIAWRDAYLISPHHYHPKRPPHVWWLERDGRVQEVSLPTELPFPMEGGIDFFPSSTGLFIRYNGASSKGLSGGYFLRNGKLEHVVDHFVQSEEFSPDGCKMVFDHTSYSKDYYSQKKPYRTLKMINFCTQGGKQ